MKFAIGIIIVILFHFTPSAHSLAQYHPPLCFKHPVAPVLKIPDHYRPLRPDLGPSMTLWTHVKEAAHAATNVCVYSCIVAPVFYSGFAVTIRVVDKIESVLGPSSFYVAPAIFVGARLTRVAIMRMKSRGLGSFRK
jgi:hypothetical protein